MNHPYGEPDIKLWHLAIFAAVCAAMSGLGFYFFFVKSLPERDAYAVIEGELVPGSVTVRKALRFRVEGYQRELFLTHPKERAAPVAKLLAAPQRLRVRVDPWSNNPQRSTVMELDALDAAGTATPLYTFDELLAWEIRNNRLGGGIGLFFGAFALGLLLILRARWLGPADLSRLPATGAITQRFYVSYPKALTVFTVCGCMVGLFAWGVSQFHLRPLLALLSIPMGLLFLLVTALQLPWLVPFRAQLVIDEEGIVDQQLGFGRIPWDRIDRLEILPEEGLDYLRVEVLDEAALLRERGRLPRLLAWCNRRLGYGSITICLFPLDATSEEVARVLESHGHHVMRY